MSLGQNAVVNRHSGRNGVDVMSRLECHVVSSRMDVSSSHLLFREALINFVAHLWMKLNVVLTLVL